MGMGEEYRINSHAQYLDFLWSIQEMADTKTWVTKDGRRIPFSEMSDSHLENTIKMLLRNDAFDNYADIVALMKIELNKRKRRK